MTAKTVASLAEMQKLAQGLAEELTGGDVLLLSGPLGAGKTTFVQALAKELGIAEQITSPTFTVVAEYNFARPGTIRRFVHVDLYRLEDGEAAGDTAVQNVLEDISNPDQLTVIEWAEKLGKLSIPRARYIQFDHGRKSNERIVAGI